ncbi:DUF6612 family protein [Paenibacillus marinisediminis]
MKKKWMKGALAMMLASVLVVTGCGAKQSSKEAVESAFNKSLEMKSYAFTSSVAVDDLQLSGESFAGEDIGAMLTMFKNAKLDISGAIQQEPMQADMKLGVEIPGDMALKFELPMMMAQDKLYVKVPNIPMLPMPAEMVDKFIELDMKQLAEESGQDISFMTNMETTRKFSSEFFSSVVSKFDEKTYFKDIAVKDAGLPEDVKAKQVVKFAVTKDNFDQAATTFVKDALPALLDLMSKEEYRSYFQLEQADIDTLKSELTQADSDIKQGLDELKQTLTVNELSMTTGIDKDGYPVYQKLVIDIDANDAGDNIKLKLNFTNKMSNINGEQKFSSVPTDVITMDQLGEMMGGF